MNEILTVSQVNGYLKSLLDDDVQLKSIYIRGEISNFTHHLKTGHFYFTLKDARTSIKAVMFRGNASHLRFIPQNGMSVILFGSVQLFERDGICQIICADMQPDGLGALYMAFEQLKSRLAAEGLFAPEHKRPLPPYPRKIAVVTAKSGAALQDIIHILGRRWPVAELTLYPALVQGEKAPESIVRSLLAAGKDSPDLIIVGRGGGSLEDLWAFNDERVARAVYASPVPVISAVGHETDYTICDFAADLRVPTPSAAAEICSPEIESVRKDLESMSAFLNRFLSENLSREEKALDAYSRRIQVSSPLLLLNRRGERLSELRLRMDTALKNRLSKAEVSLSTGKKRLKSATPEKILDTSEALLRSFRKSLIQAAEKTLLANEAVLREMTASLEALSPLKVLSRGYTLTLKEGYPAKAKMISPGDRLTTHFVDATVESIVTSITPGGKDLSYGHEENSDI